MEKIFNEDLSQKQISVITNILLKHELRIFELERQLGIVPKEHD